MGFRPWCTRSVLGGGRGFRVERSRRPAETKDGSLDLLEGCGELGANHRSVGRSSRRRGPCVSQFRSAPLSQPKRRICVKGQVRGRVIRTRPGSEAGVGWAVLPGGPGGAPARAPIGEPTAVGRGAPSCAPRGSPFTQYVDEPTVLRAPQRRSLSGVSTLVSRLPLGPGRGPALLRRGRSGRSFPWRPLAPRRRRRRRLRGAGDTPPHPALPRARRTRQTVSPAAFSASGGRYEVWASRL